MAEELLYLHFGRQCPGDYFAEQARRAAELLQLPFRSVDVTGQPDLASRHNLFCPGALYVGDIQLIFPGPAEVMVESYRRGGGPLPGEQEYQAKPAGRVDRVEILRADNCGCAFRSCLRRLSDQQERQKAEWLRQLTGGDFAGLIGWQGNEVVAFAEVLPETAVPYPLEEKRADYGFVTCLYSPIEWGLDRDYRGSLLEQLFTHARDQGYRGLSVISGVETPYPNGPLAIFEQLGFQRTRRMGGVLLRHKWEEAWLMQRALGDQDGSDRLSTGV